MRFSLTLLPVAIALTLASSIAAETTVQGDKKVMHGTVIENKAPSSSSNSTSPGGLAEGLEKFFDDDGKEMEFYDDGGDPFGDDDEEEDESSSPQRRSKKHTKHHKIASKKNSAKYQSTGSDGEQFPNPVQVTWYASHDLLAPACGTGDWNPTSSSHIGAVMAGWEGGPKCGEFVDICNKSAGNKCVTVRIIDQCGGCKANAVDLTKSLFKRLSPSGTLDEGRMHGLTMHKSKKPNPWGRSLFGPFKMAVTGMV